MGDNAIPVSIGKQADPVDALAEVLGQSASDILRLHLSVIDREDRLESGTGEWLSSFRADRDDRESVARESVLRALRMASDATNFRILQKLTDGVGIPIEDVSAASGLGRLALAERLGDLVSAGLAAKIPEANQVAGVPAGAALVRLVETAVAQTAGEMGKDHR